MEWKFHFCGILETHVTERFWKAEDIETYPHFRKFLDKLKDENYGGSKIILNWL